MKIDSLDHLVLSVRDIGASGPILPGYLRDPDGKPIEVANPA